MDAIRLHMAGFHETVASLGTALTENQGELLRRYAGLVMSVTMLILQGRKQQ